MADFNSSVSVPFQRMRQMLLDQGGGIQEGVVGVNDFKVVQRGAGANMSVDVGAGFAWVQIDTGTRNGLGHVTNDAVANVTVTASSGTNPRIDQIILRWNDTSIPTGSGNIPTLAVLTGTATVGATLDNRTGAAALPSDCLRLADLLIPTSSTSVVTANIRDRRPWARGAFNRLIRTAGDLTTTSASQVILDATNLQARVECSGAPVRVRMPFLWKHTVAGSTVNVVLAVDNVALGLNDGSVFQYFPYTTGVNFSGLLDVTFIPAAGSHLIAPYWSTSAATATMIASGANAPVMTIEEILRSNANNGVA